MSMQISASPNLNLKPFRSLAQLGLLAVGLAALATDARAQANRDSDLFPARRRNSWTFDVNAGQQATTLTATVARVRSGADGSEMIMEWLTSDGHKTQTEVYRLSAAGVDRLVSGKDGECRYSPPFPVVRYPLAAGRRWTWKGVMQFPRREVAGSAVLTAAAPSSVQTPAGAFQAVRVHCDLTLTMEGRAVTQPTDTWFAPGVGIVQQRIQSGTDIIDGRLTAYNLRPERSDRPAARLSAPAGNAPLTRFGLRQR